MKPQAALLLALCLAATTATAADQTAPSGPSGAGAVLGSWAVRSVTDQYENGRTEDAWGPGLKGNILFSRDGHFAEILIGAADPKRASNDPLRPDAPVYAYFGSFRVDRATSSILVHVAAASNSRRSGADQIWHYTAMGTRLELEGSPRATAHGNAAPRLSLTRDPPVP